MEQAIAEELQVTLIDVLGVELFRGTHMMLLSTMELGAFQV
jgi:hypothetical protein